MRLTTALIPRAILVIVFATTVFAAPDGAQEPPSRDYVVRVGESDHDDSAWIGVWLQDVIDGGIQIVAVVPGGPASLASLRAGDIIVEGNSRPLPEQTALNRLLSALSPGEPLVLRVVRGGKTIDAPLVVASRAARSGTTLSLPRLPSAPEAPERPPRPERFTLFGTGRARALGVLVTDVTPALRTHYGAPEDYGVLVTRSEAGGIAARSGIAVGDVIVRVGGSSIASSRQFEAVLSRWNPESPLHAEMVRGGKPVTVELNAMLESRVEEEQDRAAKRAAERELMIHRLKLELERLDRRTKELRQELSKLERDD